MGVRFGSERRDLPIRWHWQKKGSIGQWNWYLGSWTISFQHCKQLNQDSNLTAWSCSTVKEWGNCLCRLKECSSDYLHLNYPHSIVLWTTRTQKKVIITDTFPISTLIVTFSILSNSFSMKYCWLHVSMESQNRQSRKPPPPIWNIQGGKWWASDIAYFVIPYWYVAYCISLKMNRKWLKKWLWE